MKNFGPVATLVLGLILFTVLNPVGSLYILALLLIAIIIGHKIGGELAVLALLALRPSIDWWRNYGLFTYRSITLNVNAAISLLLIAWAVWFFIKNKKYWREIPVKLLWLAFIVWCTVTFFYSYDPVATITETLKMTNLFSLFGVLFVLHRKYPDRLPRMFVTAVIAGAIPPLLLGTYQFVTRGGATIDDIPNRIYGTFAHPNLLGIFALFLIIFGIHFVFGFRLRLKKRSELEQLVYMGSIWRRLLPWRIVAERNDRPIDWHHVAGGLFLSAIILFTYARVAWIGLALLVAGISLFFYRRFLVGMITAVVIFYSLFYPLNTWLARNYQINLQSNTIIARLTARNESADSIKWRAELANRIVPLLRTRLAQGYGYGSFTRVWDQKKGVSNIWDNSSEAHNDFLKVAFETGLVGIGLYLLIFAGILIWSVWQAVRHHAPILLMFLASILLFLAMSVSDNMLVNTPAVWWYAALWGYLAAEMRVNK